MRLNAPGPVTACLVALCACAPVAAQGRRAASASAAGDDGPLSVKYPGDEGIERDPAVVWYEGFEQSSVANLIARYDDHKNAAGMALVPDVPAGSAGKAALRMRAGGPVEATDLFKSFPKGEEELFVRWYVKYQAGGKWHHSGVWFGGQNPPRRYPSARAGSRPSGEDRFSLSVEPMNGGTPSPRLDVYAYWMEMRSWKDQPADDDPQAYWGNTVIQKKGFRVDDDAWMCLEVRVRLNPAPASRAGAALAVWKNDELVRAFDEKGPLGFWIKDKFCTADADTSNCVQYRPAEPKWEPLDLRWRSTGALALNAIWPQNYITDGPPADITFDDIVVARARIGCLRPHRR